MRVVTGSKELPYYTFTSFGASCTFIKLAMHRSFLQHPGEKYACGINKCAC